MSEFKEMIDDRVNELFKDAESLYREALRELEGGKIRDAAEKAWGATLRATNGLILAKTGNEPKKTPLTSRELEQLSLKNGDTEKLRIADRYHTRADYLHGECFYLGICEPREPIMRRVSETIRYIKDAKKLAGA
jgi:HEPN domain-containing protein